MRLGELDTNNWAPLLRLRDSLIRNEGTGHSDSVHNRDHLEAVSIEHPHTGMHDEGHDSAGTPTQAAGGTVHRIRNPRNRPLPPQSRDQIRRLADSGLSAREVAARHGVHEGTVRAIWRERPRPKRRGPHRFTEEDRQRAEVLLAQGKTLIEIGLELGFDRGTVRKHLK